MNVEKEKMNWNAFLLFLARRITLVSTNDINTHFPPTLLIRVILFASQMPSLCSNAISICLNTSLIPKKNEKKSGFTAIKVFLLQLLGRLCFFPHCFVSMVTFWVALPQVTSITCYPIQRVVTFKRWLAWGKTAKSVKTNQSEVTETPIW